MTKEEAIRILDPETSRDALWKYEDNRERLEAVNEACRVAVSALLAQPITQLPNAPLTMDELREMDGEPVWGVFPGMDSRYMIIQWHNSEFFKTFECGFLLVEEYGKTWLAYRRKPEEGEDAAT